MHLSLFDTFLMLPQFKEKPIFCKKSRKRERNEIFTKWMGLLKL
jgi:hypothetical protein